MTEQLTSRPGHVPQQLVCDIDAYDPPGWREDLYGAWKRVRDDCPPIFWTPHQGGHWVVTRFDDIKYIAECYDEFSSKENFIPRGVAPPQLPINIDPPEHTAVRRLLTPAVMPKAIKILREKVRHNAQTLIADLYPQGECDFVRGFGSVLPVMAFLSLMGLPEEDHAFVNRIGGDITRLDAPEIYARARLDLSNYMQKWIEIYRKQPGEGLISSIVNGEVDGRPLNNEQVENLCVLVLSAGIDTVKAAICFAANFLAQSPDHRRQLIAEPGVIPQATEELFRRFGGPNLARVVREDLIYKGVSFRAGEMVLLPFPLAGLDDDVNADPLIVDFKRSRIKHLDFGAGPHMCVGAALARTEMMIFLEEWLRKIPDFEIKPGGEMKCVTGLVNIPIELSLRWLVAA